MENAKITAKYGDWIQAGFNLYKENFVTLVISSLIAFVLSFVSFFILAGPLIAGLTIIGLGCLDKKEPKPEIGNLFDGFQFFLDSFLFVVVWGAVLIGISLLLGLILCAGQILSVFISITIGTLLLFGMLLIVDRKMSFWPASLESINFVKNNFLPFAGLMIISSAIGYVGILACGVGVIITMPLAICIPAVAYRDLFGKA
jgi:uncharacterized membrane protein